MKNGFLSHEDLIGLWSTLVLLIHCIQALILGLLRIRNGRPMPKDAQTVGSSEQGTELKWLDMKSRNVHQSVTDACWLQAIPLGFSVFRV